MMTVKVASTMTITMKIGIMSKIKLFAVVAAYWKTHNL